MTEYVVSMEDINKKLLCTVSTSSPEFSEQASTALHVIGTYIRHDIVLLDQMWPSLSVALIVMAVIVMGCGQ